jgi:hypothetical protein
MNYLDDLARDIERHVPPERLPREGMLSLL